MTYVIVLGKNPTEANAYAKAAELPKGRWRFAARAATVKGLRVAEIHELPSFAARPDRHAINAVLRHTKAERILISGPQPEQTESLYDALTDEELEDAYLLNDSWGSRDPGADRSALAAQTDDDTFVPYVEGYTVAELDEAYAMNQEHDEAAIDETRDESGVPTRKRRTRCPVCDELTWGPDAEGHNVFMHQSAQTRSGPDPEPAVANFFG